MDKKEMSAKEYFRWHIATVLDELLVKYEVPYNLIEVIKKYVEKY